jgi:hypothetical protein
MQRLFGRPVFEVGEVGYTWLDVVLFAMLTGRWTPLDRAIREGLACVRHLEQNDLEEPETAIDEFAAEFRYERDLITADETEAWLADRELETSDWMAWVRREVLRKRWAAEVESLLRRYPVEASEVVTAAAADLLCSGRGGDLAADLAQRAAVTAVLEEAGQELEAVPRPGVVERVRTYLPELDAAAVEAQLTRLAELEEGHARFRAVAATPELIHKELELGRLEWIRIDCRLIQFETEALAREAGLCVREDRLGVDEVAENAHALVQEMRFYLGELDPDLQPRMLAAAPQELVGPVPFEGGYALFLVLDKVLPDEKAPDLRKEVERRAIARAVTDQVNRRVRWLDG